MLKILVNITLVALAMIMPAFAFADGAVAVEVAVDGVAAEAVAAATTEAAGLSIEQIGLVVTSLLVFLTHLAAMLGRPGWVDKLGTVGKLVNGLLSFLAGNYGKAKNQDSQQT